MYERSSKNANSLYTQACIKWQTVGLWGSSEAQEGTICCNWGNLLRHPEISLQHCGLESRVRAMKCHGGCQFWANSVSILLGSHWASYPFLIHLTLHHLPLFFCFFCSTNENAARVFSYHWLCFQSLLSKMSLILWTMPPLLPILPILPGNLFLVSLALVPVVPVALRASLRPAGMVKGTGTAGILDHPDYCNPLTIISSPSRQGVFHPRPYGNLSKFPVIPPIVVSYLDIKQSFTQILDFP